MRTQNTRGFAIVIVLLVSSVILISVVVTASLTALGSRVSAADERTSYQALLAAESGIDTLAARAEIEEYRGTLNEAVLNNWLSASVSGVGVVSFDNGNNARVTVENITPSPYNPNINTYTVTFRSESSVAGDRGRKVVAQQYRLTQPPRPNVSVPAALTSWPNVTVGGRVQVTGVDGSMDDGLVEDVTRVDGGSNVFAPGSRFDLSVDNAFELPPGEYIQINGDSYRVDAITDETTVVLTAVPPLSATRTISDDAEIDIIQYATTASSTDTPAGTVRVTNSGVFSVDDKIYVNSVEATVNSVDRNTNSLSVSWAGGATPSFAEGAVITKDYFGAASKGSIGRNGNNASISTKDDNSSSVAQPNTGELFKRTFGVAYEDFSAAYPSVSSASPPFSGVTHLSPSNGNLNLGGNMCGSGILVVDGDFTFNGTCSAGFSGVIYVRGSYNQQGNSEIIGAVVAEGPTQVNNDPSQLSPSDTTQLAGAGTPKLEFDPDVLYRQSRLLSPWQFETIAGTWRQR